MKCPNCGSDRVVKAGYNYYKNIKKQKYICQECRKVTSNPVVETTSKES